MTNSIKKFLETTDYRRKKQLEYNKEHHITPKSVKRELQLSLDELTKAREVEASVVREAPGGYRTAEVLRELEQEMLEAAENLQFEKAAILRDQIEELKKEGDTGGPRRAGGQIRPLADSVAAAPVPKRQVKYDRKLKVNVVKKARRSKRLSS
jgi:excinuclease ABC subunit B